MPRTDERLLARAKQLRTEMTPAAACLWFRLRLGRRDGIKFVRQAVRRPFTARSRKLIIAVDGDAHGSTEGCSQTRTTGLEREGYRVLRFTNAYLMRNADGVMQVILEALRTAPLPSAAFGGLSPIPVEERGR